MTYQPPAGDLLASMSVPTALPESEERLRALLTDLMAIAEHEAKVGACLDAGDNRGAGFADAARWTAESNLKALPRHPETAGKVGADLRALLDERTRLRATIAEAETELREIDATFGNVSGLNRRWTRPEKIAHMLRVLRAVNAPADPPAALHTAEDTPND